MGAEAKQIINLTNGATVCERGVLADGPLRRLRGLMGRSALDPGEGLLLRPAPGIHTAFMRFSIDAIFLDANLEVLSIAESLRPWRVASKRGARAVLEVSTGEAVRRGVSVGDQLGLFDTRLAASTDKLDDVGVSHPLSNPFPRSITPLPQEFAPHGTAGQQTRVLLIAHDRRFRTVAAALLARRGCAVTASANAQRVAELVISERVDVVVVDAGPLLTAAARTVAAVDAITPPVGVVLVADESEAGLRDLPVLAKWGPFEELFSAIEQADRDRGHRSRLVG